MFNSPFNATAFPTSCPQALPFISLPFLPFEFIAQRDHHPKRFVISVDALAMHLSVFKSIWIFIGYRAHNVQVDTDNAALYLIAQTPCIVSLDLPIGSFILSPKRKGKVNLFSCLFFSSVVWLFLPSTPKGTSFLIHLIFIHQMELEFLIPSSWRKSLWAVHNFFWELFNIWVGIYSMWAKVQKENVLHTHSAMHVLRLKECCQRA